MNYLLAEINRGFVVDNNFLFGHPFLFFPLRFYRSRCNHSLYLSNVDEWLINLFLNLLCFLRYRHFSMVIMRRRCTMSANDLICYRLLIFVTLVMDRANIFIR